MKSQIRRLLARNARVDAAIRAAMKAWRTNRLLFRCYVYDFSVAKRNLSWDRTGNDYWKLSAELIFQYHKLEKGLCLPAPRRFFGLDAVRETMRLLREWDASGLPADHPVRIAALEVLRAYRARLDVTPPPEDICERLVREVETFVGGTPPVSAMSTPITPVTVPPGAFEALSGLAEARRSIRSFDGAPVDFALVEKALRIAQLAPSACNRQPWRIHFYDQPDQIAAMLALQNGNNGFRQTIPLLAVVSADMNCFFDASERIEPVLDSGLFLMSFLLGLQSVGLSSCCLNWCVAPDQDRRAHEVGAIPDNHQIATFLAIGRATEHAIAPRSARRPLADVVVRH